ncbi:MAG: class I SAM-dependent methyltransferase [Methanomicrobiales archaeon]
MNSHLNWKKFSKKIPSTVPLDKLFLDKISTDKEILDWGCGWGRIDFELQEKGYTVTGFDINSELISISKDFAVNTNSKHENKVQFHVANALNLPYDDKSFDVCLMQAFMTTVVDVDDRSSVLNEANRVLGEDGIIYMAEFAQSWENPIYRDRYLSDFDLTGEKCTFIVTKDGTVNTAEIYRAHHFSEQELRDLIEPFFNIDIIEKREFTSYHGNWSNGIIIIASKS